MKRVFLFFALLTMALFSGCGSAKHRLDVDVSKTGLPEMKIHRYDLDLFRVHPGRLQQELEALKPSYRFFLGTDLGDAGKLDEMRAYLENPRTVAFQAAVAGRYADIRMLEHDLTDAFRHFLYYYPGSKIPRVYAYISGGDYDFPIQFADTVLLIGLDNYLGKDFKPYASDGLPNYRILRMNPENILPDCMKVLSTVTDPEQLPGNTMLEQMVEAGKRLYFIDAMIPAAGDRFKIGYTQAQYDWIIKNETHVWAAIIENRMLYATDGKLIRAFMADGPFTAEFSKEAPPRLGEWLGWQIIRRYMENQPGVSLQQLMKERDAQKILTTSGYKPEK
ncbi:MAG: hypothetical protein WCO44_08265 [Bacteroidota bacterium]